MKTAAAIRRASQQARNAMRDLDAANVEELLQLYGDTADEVRAAIGRRVDGSNLVPREQLQALLRQIEEIITALGARRDALLFDSLNYSAALGVRPYTAQGIAAVGADGAAQAVLDSGAAMRVSQTAVEFVRSFHAADGLALSDRLWRLDLGAKEALQRAISNAVVQGWSASRAAAQLAYEGRSVPPELARTLKNASGSNLQRLADLLTSRDGGEVWKADRVFRTEINRAHGEAYMAGGENTPGFAGWRYLLSPAHPAPDICDLLAAQNLHGLGQGVYPTREATPWPAHPNTLSFVEIKFLDEVSEADRAGKESELQALQRLSPEIRAGVLGVAKAAYFDQGLLSKGMLRSPLRAVEERLARREGPSAAEMSSFVDRSLDTKDRRLLMPIGPVLNHQAVRSATGYDLRGYQHVLDNYGVIHTQKHHGNPAAEAKRGQLAVTARDYSLLGQVLAAPDRMFADGKNKIGRDVVVFTKLIDGVGYRLAVEIRTKGKKLALDSMRKKKGAWGS